MRRAARALVWSLALTLPILFVALTLLHAKVPMPAAFLSGVMAFVVANFILTWLEHRRTYREWDEEVRRHANLTALTQTRQTVLGHKLHRLSLDLGRPLPGQPKHESGKKNICVGHGGQLRMDGVLPRPADHRQLGGHDGKAS